MITAVGYLPATTQAPSLELYHDQLRRRDLSDTCAWSLDIPKTCPVNEYCVYVGSYFGCAPWNSTASAYETVPIASTCLDRTAYETECTDGCGGSTAWCGRTDYPYCATLILPDSDPDVSSSWTSYGCRVYADQTVILANTPETAAATFSSASASAAVKTVTVSAAAPTMATTIPPSAAAASTGPSSETAPATQSSSAAKTSGVSDSSNNSDSSVYQKVAAKNASVGAIVGGVVGGVVGLGLLALLAFFIFRKRRNNPHLHSEKDRMYTHYGGPEPEPGSDDKAEYYGGSAVGSDSETKYSAIDQKPQELAAEKYANEPVVQELAADKPTLEPYSQVSELPG